MLLASLQVCNPKSLLWMRPANRTDPARCVIPIIVRIICKRAAQDGRAEGVEGSCLVRDRTVCVLF
jgi:hypothetical protein